MNLLISVIVLAALLLAAWKYRIVPFGMMALTDDADVPTRAGNVFAHPVGSAKKIYAGALVVLSSTGYAEPGTAATGKIAAGRARFQVDNTNGNDGDKTVEVETGVFRYLNSAGGDEITRAQIGDACFIVDDTTVAKTSGTNTRSVAGYIFDVDSEGVWVSITPIQSADGDLVAANNLSDVANAATARSNLGANLVVLGVNVTDLRAAQTQVVRIVSPVAGVISKVYSVIDGALATGDATLTAKIGANAVTNGVITITQASSAAGDADSATPTAARTVAAGDVISLTVGGSNTAQQGAMCTILIAT